MGAKHADVNIVGLGAHGSAAAWQLAKRGVSVIGFDAFCAASHVGFEPRGHACDQTDLRGASWTTYR